MHTTSARSSANRTTYLALVIAASLSGCAAVVYEVLYASNLELILGATPNLIVATLATFLTGISVGAMLSRRCRHWLWLTELLLGLYAVGFAILLKLDASVLVTWASLLPLDVWPRMTAAVILMAPPAALVGISVPGFTAWMSAIANERATRSFNVIYTAYHLFAAGCVIATIYWSLPDNGMNTTMLVLGLINVGIGITLFRIRRSPRQRWLNADQPQADLSHMTLRVLWPIVVAGVLSGLIQDEFIVWLNIVFGPLIENLAVAVILAMIGMGAGALCVDVFLASRKTRGSRGVFALVTAFAGLAVIGVAWLTLVFTPHAGMVKSWFGIGPISALLPSIGLGVVLYTAIGATVPAFYSEIEQSRDASSAGRMLSASAAGNVIGYLGFVGLVGAGLSDKWLLVMASGGFIALSIYWLVHTKRTPGQGREVHDARHGERGLPRGITARPGRLIPGVSLVTMTLACALIGGWLSNQTQPISVTLQVLRNHEKPVVKSQVFSEGILRDVVTHLSDDTYRLFLSGYLTSSQYTGETETHSVVMGAMPAYMVSRHNRALVVGSATGTTASTLAEYYKHVDVVDVDPNMMPLLKTFETVNDHVLKKKNLSYYQDDAFAFLCRKKRKYNSIVLSSSGLSYFSAYALYTRRYFELDRQHLTQHGVLVQWFDSRLSVSGIKSLEHTIRQVFPYVRWVPFDSWGEAIVASKSPIHFRQVKMLHPTKRIRNVVGMYQINDPLVRYRGDRSLKLGHALKNIAIKPPDYPDARQSTLDHPFLTKENIVNIFPNDTSQVDAFLTSRNFILGLYAKRYGISEEKLKRIYRIQRFSKGESRWKNPMQEQ